MVTSEIYAAVIDEAGLLKHLEVADESTQEVGFVCDGPNVSVLSDFDPCESRV